MTSANVRLRSRRYLSCALLALFVAVGCENDSDGGSPNCVPSCGERRCGDDGCGGICPPGCDERHRCEEGRCVLAPGACTPSQRATNCAGRDCGDDGCGGFCPPGCDLDHACFEGLCIPVGRDCSPEGRAARCALQECGDDGCGGSCGMCHGCAGEQPELCTAAGICIVPCCPDCTGRECGDDGCGGRCGECPHTECDDVTGLCLPCEPDCTLDPCARDDGCGGRCDACPLGQDCAMTGMCGVLIDCREYYVCTGACATDDEACMKRCDDRVSYEVFLQLGDYINCWIDRCATATGSALNSCIERNCAEAYNTCMGF